jgi:hypothetical protein
MARPAGLQPEYKSDGTKEKRTPRRLVSESRLLPGSSSAEASGAWWKSSDEESEQRDDVSEFSLEPCCCSAIIGRAMPQVHRSQINPCSEG